MPRPPKKSTLFSYLAVQTRGVCSVCWAGNPRISAAFWHRPLHDRRMAWPTQGKAGSIGNGKKKMMKMDTAKEKDWQMERDKVVGKAEQRMWTHRNLLPQQARTTRHQEH